MARTQHTTRKAAGAPAARVSLLPSPGVPGLLPGSPKSLTATADSATPDTADHSMDVDTLPNDPQVDLNQDMVFFITLCHLAKLIHLCSGVRVAAMEDRCWTVLIVLVEQPA